MATTETIDDVVNLLFDSPLANKPKRGEISATTRVFAATLRDIEDNLLRAAVVQHIGTNKWFPSVADLRECAVSVMRQSDDTPDSYTAWLQVTKAISTYGSWRIEQAERSLPPTVLKAINAIGGLRELALSDTDDYTSWRARFVSCYDQQRIRQEQNAMMLPAVSSYIQQRQELGGRSISGLIGDVTKQLTGAAS